MDRGHRDPGLELPGDVVVMRLDRRPGHLPQPGVRQLREPLPGGFHLGGSPFEPLIPRVCA
jgi:hypothetical protein